MLRPGPSASGSLLRGVNLFFWYTMFELFPGASENVSGDYDNGEHNVS